MLMPVKIIGRRWTESGFVTMRLLRHSLMLILTVALLLPPGLYRDCCCTRRAALSQAKVASAPLRSCCQARLKLAAQTAARHKPTTPSLSGPLCRCQAASQTVAVIRSAQRTISGIDRPMELSYALLGPMSSDDAHQPATLFSITAYRDPDPPAREILCRWLI